MTDPRSGRRISLMAQALSACLRLGQDARLNPAGYSREQLRAARRIDKAAREAIESICAEAGAVTIYERSVALDVSVSGVKALDRLIRRD